LDQLVEGIENAGGSTLAVSCDITDESQAHALIQRTEEEFGRADILVNNAGVMLLWKVAKGLSDQWRQMFEVNVYVGIASRLPHPPGNGCKRGGWIRDVDQAAVLVGSLSGGVPNTYGPT
jgi:NAD(P)-dependent dehydrogenase (short-subunit alcohol dehydrogenase family)